MLHNTLYPLLSQVEFEKRVFMDIKAVGAIGLLRFMVNDYSHGGDPDFYLNISELESEKDLVGLHVGHPIKLEPKIIEEAEADAKGRGLDPVKTQLLIVAHVLAKDRIREKLSEKRGGCPPEMNHIFAMLKSMDERALLSEISKAPEMDVKAKPRTGL